MIRMIPTLAFAVCTLAAAPAAFAQTAATPAAVPAAPAGSASPADKLTGVAAWERLKGNTIEGKAGGQTFTEFFDAGGGVKYVDKDGPSTGTWTVQSPKVCFDFPDDDDRSCSTFEVTGTSGTAKDDDGTIVQFDITPGNGKGL